ncbi:MAG: tRNA (guanosine(46)-N7)-methyltransferase TrmB [Clostridiales bacterium]|jgi:tRNA (guanine-N7-)-methyltransferase|nr:tRNA (guanosine(46)-N7)-methyltransferase TrmB [Clostridiales bacterium]
MRTRKKNWTARELAENERIIKEPQNLCGKWREYFGNVNPIQLEIGCGKGKFLAASAQAFPQINFIGIERDPTILAQAARLARNTPGLSAYIISEAEAMSEYFAPGEIEVLYIQFCDPWPNKKKWAKRRLTHGRFLDIYYSLGINVIHFKTDNRALFDFSIQQFSEKNWLLRNISLDLHSTPQDTRFITEYEAKFVDLGMPIYRLEAVKPAKGDLCERPHHQTKESDSSNAVHSEKESNNKSGYIKDFG